jgi:hypothetical protein
MGPSKEELSNYFKNNRKYFDELAHHFKQTDPAYYNEYIAPFYGSAFLPRNVNRAKSPMFAVFAAIISVLILGLTLFIVLFNETSKLQREAEKNIYEGNEPVENEDGEFQIQHDPIKMLDTLSSIRDFGNYEKGIMYFNLGDFNKAEKFLQKVPENDVLYKDAKEKLNEIKKKK